MDEIDDYERRLDAMDRRFMPCLTCKHDVSDHDWGEHDGPPFGFPCQIFNCRCEDFV